MNYSFLNFGIDLYNCVILAYNYKFNDSLSKITEIYNILKNYYFYNCMKYLNNKFTSGVYRLHSTDYNNTLYIPNLNNLPFKNLQLGHKPEKYVEFHLTLCTYVWRDLLYFIGDNPILCLIFFTLYLCFPYFTYFILFVITLYYFNLIFHN
jgi:hypothetical protein